MTLRALRATCALSALVLLLLLPHPTGARRPRDAGLPPNIVLVLTDDQDTWATDVDAVMPQTKALVQDAGTKFTRAFANTPVCCPSRATLLSGRLPHSSGMTVSNRVNCGGQDWRSGPERDSVAVRMQNAGYRTLYAGKYLNTYGTGDPLPSHVPPGWSEWFALVGNSKYWNYSMSDEGVTVSFGDISGAGDYLTDSLARRAARFISAATEPFFVWVSPPAAHAPFSASRRHAGTRAGLCVRRTAAFDLLALDKHEPFRSAPGMTEQQMLETDEIFRSRVEALGAVDDLVVTLVAALEDRQVREDTVFVFTSDHGFHLGQFRLGFDKRQPYDTDILVPLLMSGPGVPRNRETDMFVSHADLGPTLLDLALVPVPDHWDGRSYKRALMGLTSEPSSSLASVPAAEFAQLVLVEYRGEGDPSLSCGAGRAVFDALGRARENGSYIPAPCDAWNNTYACLRGSRSSFVGHEFLYCEFECFDKGVKGKRAKVPCLKGTPEDLGEFYDIDADPLQIANVQSQLTPRARALLKDALREFRTCKGSRQCAKASTWRPSPREFWPWAAEHAAAAAATALASLL